jgi:hypothetical protein
LGGDDLVGVYVIVDYVGLALDDFGHGLSLS